MNKRTVYNLFHVIILSLLMVFITFVVFPYLPESITVETIDGSSYMMAKWPYVYLIPLFILIGGVMLEVVVLGDPRQKHLVSSNNAYHNVVLVIMVLMMLIDIIFLTDTLAIALPTMKLSILLFGFSLVFLGNQLPKLKPNHIIGFRTPWAMDNDVVWIKTHRFAGYLFLFGGLLTLMTPLLSAPTDFNIAALIFLALLIIPIIYSFLYYLKKGSTHDK